MRGAYLDRARASALLRQAGADALIALQPETIQYATGANPGVAALFRRAGAAIALTPADPALTCAAVMPDLAAGAVSSGCDIADIRFLPIWVGTADYRAGLGGPLAERLSANAGSMVERPATFDQRAAFGHLRDMLAERNLLGATLALELDFLPVNDFAVLREILPEARIVDGSGIVRRLRMIKSQREIALLRTALELSEVGLGKLLPEIREGVSRDDLGAAFVAHVRAEARARGTAGLTNVWEYISVGTSPWGAAKQVAPGDIIKVDIGAVLSGYSSDCARTFIFGHASADQKAVHAALQAGFDAGFPLLTPGRRLADIHAAMIGAIRRAGLPGYTRGHFGHGLGQSLFSEEWPFIAADSDVVVEPDMVLALEAPYYVDGLGGFIIEDQVLITNAGAESMNHLPQALVAL